MTLKLGAFDWNKYALVITGFFIVFMVSKVNLLPQLPNCLSYISCPPWYIEFQWTMKSLVFLVGGIAGLKASKSFGGRKNFTGKLLFYLSLFMFVLGPVYYFLVYLDGLPNPLSNWLSYNVLLPYSGIDWWDGTLAYCFPAYALVVSLRSVWDRFDWKSWLVIIFSLAFGLFVAWFEIVYFDPASGTTTVLDTIINGVTWPILVSVQLAAGVLLLRALGRWYVNKSITAILVLYLFLGVVVVALKDVVFTWIVGLGNATSASSLNLELAIYYANFLLQFFPLFLFSMVLTQIKPRTKGPFF